MNIYEFLKNNLGDENYYIPNSVFSTEFKETLTTDSDKLLFDLIKNISSLALKISASGAEFYPMMIFNGKRTFSVEDLKDDDYALLNTIDLSKVPINLRARIADILWLEKKDYKAAQIAAENYLALYNLWYNESEWFEALDMIKRAIYISAQIKLKDIYNNCCQTIYEQIIALNGNDKDFLSISLINVIYDQSYGDSDNIIDILDRIIVKSKGNPNKTEHAYKLKFKYLNKVKKFEDAKFSKIKLAEYFVDFAESCAKKEEYSALKAQYFFEKAISLYRNNGEPTKAELTHKRLIEIQKDIPKLLHIFKIPFDGEKNKKYIEQNMEGLSFKEAVIKLSQLIHFYKKEEFKIKVLNEAHEFPLKHFITNNTINEKGQTIFTLPSLASKNTQENQKVLEQHIHKKMLEFQNISGNMFLIFALSYINENFDVKNENLDFIVKDNAIIPPGREKIITLALRLALMGNYYEALHLLAPQAENIFRNIAIESGGLTVTLEKDGTSKEKVLSSIFDIPELIDCYDNDILFFFKGMLNEQAGANIRNNIAHGIMNEQQGCSGASIFFICAVIKLLVISSRQCIDILLSKKELQTYEPLPNDIVNLESENK